MGWVKVYEKGISAQVYAPIRNVSASVSGPGKVPTGGTATIRVSVCNPNMQSVSVKVEVELFGQKKSQEATLGPASVQGCKSFTFSFKAPSRPGTYSGKVVVYQYR